MKIVADENLAFTDYFFSEFGEIQNLAGRTISNDDLKDCEALLVRSVTKVNAELIKNTPIKFVGSATIGTDHLDTKALENHQIRWANAAGCNATGKLFLPLIQARVNPVCFETGKYFVPIIGSCMLALTSVQ